MENHHLKKNHHQQVILNLIFYIIVYIAMVVLSWSDYGTNKTTLFAITCLRILKTSLLLLALWRATFLAPYDLTKLFRKLLVSLYFLSLSNIITQSLRFTDYKLYNEISASDFTIIKIIVCFMPTLVYLVRKFYVYYKEQKSIIYN